MKTRILSCMLLLAILSFTSCKEDEKPKTIPVVTTAAVTDVTATTATGGGEITDGGNDEITASGLVYSSTNTTPTLADSKTVEAAKSGAFTSNLTTLSSGTTYNVRAYATNSVGTGYGSVVTFATGNAAPVATNVAITGQAEVNKLLTATYTYSDAENNAESGTTLQWYIANDGTGSGEIAIAGATASTYTPLDVQEFKYMRVGITPKAATGTATGTEVKSAFVGPIAVRTRITFTYNGAQVTYGIITSPVSGRKWLDRNLGAPNTPTAYNDFANYGDAFQWGRGADGHQLTNRAVTTEGTTGVNGTTTILSTSDTPENSLFILSETDPYDWRDPSNDNLWQGINGINNPCPAGFRIPTIEEWTTENLTTPEAAYAQMKLTLGGTRNSFTFYDVYGQTESSGDYWSSSIFEDLPGYSWFLQISIYDTKPIKNVENRGLGRMCRCIKD
jgi:hypothetical protein